MPMLWYDVLVTWSHIFVSQTTITAEQPVHQLNSPGQNGLVFFVQAFVYWLARFISLALLRRSQIELTPADIHAGKHYVLAATHQTHIDPFVVIGLLPY